MKTIHIFLVFVFLGIAFAGHKHKCVHDKISENFKPTVSEDLSDHEKQHRALQYTTSRPIKIVIDDSNLQVTPEQRDLIVGKLVPVSTEFLARRLTVVTKGSLNKISSSSCYKAMIPSAHRNVGVDADLVIYVTATNEPAESFIAWATACLQDPVTGRPIAGQINYNLAFLSFDVNQFEEQIDTTLHEITHILGFSGQLYGLFIQGFNNYSPQGLNNVFEKNVMIRGKPRQILKTKRVLETARNYFNCPTIKGVEIENEGGSGSAGAHWERAVLHNEQMTASSIVDAAYSEFTLSLLQDSGWYQVDFSRAEPMFYGKGAGCSFIDSGCTAGGRREWCSTSQPLCSFNYKYKAACTSETFSDGCKYAYGYPSANCQVPEMKQTDARGETFGPGSKCVTGTIIGTGYKDVVESPVCYKYTCTSDKKIKFFPSSGGEIICSAPNEVAKAVGSLKGTITCPDPVDFCKDYYPSCPNSCSSKGYCVKGACECRAGYTGEDCSIATDIPAPPQPKPSGGEDPCKTLVCNDRSTCQSGVCVCKSGFSGPTCDPVDPCSSVRCPENGYCSKGNCVCQQGYQGPNCDPIAKSLCVNGCSGNGACVGQNCVCNNGFSGNDCSIAANRRPIRTKCSNDCNGRGFCLGNVCQCKEGFSGAACEIAKEGASGSCPDNCFSGSGRGNCLTSRMSTNGVNTKISYKCSCSNNFLEPNCASGPLAGSPCPLNCGPKGKCNPTTKKCECENYYSGEDCSQEACVNWCSGKGYCSYNITRVNGVSTPSSYFCRCNDGSTNNNYCL